MEVDANIERLSPPVHRTGVLKFFRRADFLLCISEFENLARQEFWILTFDTLVS